MELGKLPNHLVFDDQDKEIISPALHGKADPELSQAFEYINKHREIAFKVGERLMEHVSSYYSELQPNSLGNKAEHAHRLLRTFEELIDDDKPWSQTAPSHKEADNVILLRPTVTERIETPGLSGSLEVAWDTGS
jgi:hypothetical protein